MFLIILGAGIVVAWAYVLLVREWLVATFPGGKIQWWHEQIEDRLWQSSRTILISKLYWVGGVAIMLHDLAASAGVDWTPVLTEISNLIPAQYRALAAGGFLILTGIAFQWLRTRTSGPVQRKDEA